MSLSTGLPSPDSLVVIAVAARRSGDRDLEREARAALRERHGILLSFAKEFGGSHTPEAASPSQRKAAKPEGGRDAS